MNIIIRNGQLTLGGVFKLTAISWLCFGTVFFGGIFLLLLVFGASTGSMMVNGEMVQGHGAVLTAMLPMLILVPLVIAIQSVVFAAFITAGAALYRLWRPLSVTTETTLPS